ncbi:MAG: ABC transporter permease [Dehalococcoidia bacterium]|nr:ABC transporter permease [Dehalococcoidia bacterium]
MKRLVKEKPLGLLGGGIVLVLLFTGVFADLLAPYGYAYSDLSIRLSAPSAQNLLGADNLGRDMLSRIIYGARISVVVGLVGAAIDVIVGFLVGGVSGYFGGKSDTIIQRLVEAVQCLPSLVIYLTIMAVVGQGVESVILVLGISGGVLGSRTIRSAVLGIKGNVYVESAHISGMRSRQILWMHILPNIMPVLIVEFTLAVGRIIMTEAMLSFLGFGIAPPTPSWGGMLSGAGRQYMLQAPWMVLWPGIALTITVYGVNVFGDALRDLWDPRLRGGLGRYGRKLKQPLMAAQEVMAGQMAAQEVTEG